MSKAKITECPPWHCSGGGGSSSSSNPGPGQQQQRSSSHHSASGRQGQFWKYHMVDRVELWFSVKWNKPCSEFQNINFTIILTNPMKNVTSLILIFALGTKFLQETYDLYKLKNWAHGSPAWYYLWINQDITNANRASLKTWALSFWHFPQFSHKNQNIYAIIFVFFLL